ncbi:MAG: hypothetical protein F6K25_23720 [Okeania sp. SIO2G4]|uniref:glycerophosphoryl diester phosphodiesterase membrane domain-containing protein n=1 Tax=unclassified Okeania TaxID=2634635 RepID=UPI0013BA35F0|nr:MULTISPECIES: glycerophosphoryl diester phosphodiesterase membrane domain-containing protein [unclassified Okeania]NEP08020.1 hypothetical protein [Okeania sp. SIO4D6]NEP40861.1 hypothetical protein [Okeania sp. SIO2H7]NEP74747.1 hypothetical protein [Okeania sp. SIO2G5]NEP95772.1 hypothetical protein [Okeania sp. SIO2F5]NEQ93507.1 hypothetical protein [Okeania sp. SIO2G4]
MQSQRIDPVSLLGETLDSIWPVYFPLLLIGSLRFLMLVGARLSLPPINIILLIIPFFINPLLLGTQILYIHGYFTHTSGIGEAISQTAKKFLQIILISITTSLIVLFGIILLFFPGFYMGLRLLCSLHTTLIEYLPALDGISRSWELTKGHWWSIFFAFFFLLFPIAIVLFILFVFFTSLASSYSIQEENLFIIRRFIIFLISPFGVVYSYLLYMKLKNIKELNNR